MAFFLLDTGSVQYNQDTMFHEKSFEKIKEELKKYGDSPAIAFPKYQIFTPDRYHMKTHLVVALNKKIFPYIKMNGGGDKLQPTINGNLIEISLSLIHI